jgi:hypothetical protein
VALRSVTNENNRTTVVKLCQDWAQNNRTVQQVFSVLIFAEENGTSAWLRVNKTGPFSSVYYGCVLEGLRETRTTVGCPHRRLLNGSPCTVVFYWHSTWLGDSRCCVCSVRCAYVVSLTSYCFTGMRSLRLWELKTLLTYEGVLLVINNESQHSYRRDVTYVKTWTEN